jgi:hypothetical protein
MKVSQLEEIIRNTVRKKLSEATIDVNNPATLTSQTKQQLITKARNSTKNQKIGTADDPAEFIEETDVTQPTSYQKGDKVIWTGETKPLGNGETISKGQHGVVTGAEGVFVGVDWEGSGYTHIMNSSNLEYAPKSTPIKESGTGDPNISQMSRAEMISWLGMTPREGLPWTDGELRNAMYDMTQDIEQEPADGIDEADYFDVDDNTIIEDDKFSDYNNIYERMKKIVTYKG